MNRFTGKVALITGAARGQGRSHAVTLAAEGADIIAIDRCGPIESVPYELPTPDDLAETAAEVEKLDRRIITAQVDVRDMNALSAAVDGAVSELGRLDIVSVNAGICTLAPALEMSQAVWSEMLDINLTGAWLTAKATVPHIQAGGRGGAVVFTSSDAGFRGQANLAHYVASKHGPRADEVAGDRSGVRRDPSQRRMPRQRRHPDDREPDCLEAVPPACGVAHPCRCPSTRLGLCEREPVPRAVGRSRRCQQGRPLPGLR
jgi:NADP-dependent 3-hydroxy acid dehydrogenase YdfG